jgi:hypothetical protein
VVLGRITDVQTIAAGGAIRELPRLRKYEAHGIGKKDLKLKRILEEDRPGRASSSVAVRALHEESIL